MKYIRTKDGHIFEIEKDLGRFGISKAIVICDFDGNFIDVEKQNMILKQANIIEELCDCYAYETETTKDVLVARSWKKANFEREIYGCIKTDKGLIYVAKMNEKGELELL